jgi:uncharacterized membrane protein
VRNKWLALLLVILFGNLGAIYTWKYDKAFVILALVVGALLGMAGFVEVAWVFGCILQVILIIVVLTRDEQLYKEYDKQ